jgi:hypothetical protein
MTASNGVTDVLIIGAVCVSYLGIYCLHELIPTSTGPIWVRPSYLNPLYIYTHTFSNKVLALTFPLRLAAALWLAQLQIAFRIIDKRSDQPRIGQADG